MTRGGRSSRSSLAGSMLLVVVLFAIFGVLLGAAASALLLSGLGCLSKEMRQESWGWCVDFLSATALISSAEPLSGCGMPFTSTS